MPKTLQELLAELSAGIKELTIGVSLVDGLDTGCP
jgi:hypothetical protein